MIIEDVCCKQTGRAVRSNIPEDILSDELLQKAIDFALPRNYSFEIHKILWRIRQLNSQHVGLQFPEGLLIFASQIANILIEFTSHPIEITILGDVTYGACCIDDFSAKSIGVDLLVHFGHSCLIPIEQTSLNCLYVFVEISFDYQPLVETIKKNFPIKSQSCSIFGNIDYDEVPCICLLGTIQYSGVVHAAKDALKEYYGTQNVFVPQELPLTAGEVLGCTSPNITSSLNKKPDIAIFVSDGRFHLESSMIQNPTIPFFRYDPFTQKLFHEIYDHDVLHKNRKYAIEQAKKASSVGLILGTLGRQGSVGIFEKLQVILERRNIKTTLLLMSEIMPDRIKMLSHKIDAFIQVACPRLSIDWGTFFYDIPLLTPYEAFVAFADEKYKSVYPMDYYSNNGGPWTNFNQEHRSGSLAPLNSNLQLEARRALIRKRVEERKNRLVTDVKN